MTYKLKRDICNLTGISDMVINDLHNLVYVCIADALEETLLEDEDNLEIDLGFGTLTIYVDNDSVKYKFQPSNEFNNIIKETIKTGDSGLTNTLDDLFIKRFKSVYKEFK